MARREWNKHFTVSSSRFTTWECYDCDLDPRRSAQILSGPEGSSNTECLVGVVSGRLVLKNWNRYAWFWRY